MNLTLKGPADGRVLGLILEGERCFHTGFLFHLYLLVTHQWLYLDNGLWSHLFALNFQLKNLKLHVFKTECTKFPSILSSTKPQVFVIAVM